MHNHFNYQNENITNSLFTIILFKLKFMKVSIITVCYNSEKYISDAIKSVINQTYPNIEYIIIDGGSIDNTLSIITSFKTGIHKIVSEKDNGLYDAMNKGIAIATGDIIAFLNSDDLYINNSVILEIVECFERASPDVLYADLVYVNRENINSTIRKWTSSQYINGSFTKGWHPPHPTFIVRKEVYSNFGGFNLNFSIAADFELMLRFMEKKTSKKLLPTQNYNKNENRWSI